MMKFTVNPVAKKIFGVVSIVATGAVAAINALSEQKKAQEFEAMKQVVSELQKKMGES